ncbi:MAG: DUF5668 domain-containing protein [Patescibacteria group bacterium]|nr:DUF5668 domain-containing protein [Patescibacteria group bacterium]
MKLDWFYTLLLILVGFFLLGINIGVIDSALFAYWPVILIVIALKELLENKK